MRDKLQLKIKSMDSTIAKPMSQSFAVLNVDLVDAIRYKIVRGYAENTHHRGKYHCTIDPLFDSFGFDQTSKKCLCNISKADESKQKRIYNFM